MVKRTNLYLPSLFFALSVFTITSSFGQGVYAQQVTCPPFCLDEVEHNVDDAKEALENGNIVGAQASLDIVDSLLKQLKNFIVEKD
ncbi:MAG: hypothetical protein M3162_06545 [Thermoproteota archaeon]|nr:hypothetical protein [Thermoproteota archaeon]